LVHDRDRVPRTQYPYGDGVFGDIQPHPCHTPMEGPYPCSGHGRLLSSMWLRPSAMVDDPRINYWTGAGRSITTVRARAELRRQDEASRSTIRAPSSTFGSMSLCTPANRRCVTCRRRSSWTAPGIFGDASERRHSLALFPHDHSSHAAQNGQFANHAMRDLKL